MVREESHLDDMRAAIRGDFERLAERRGGQELMQEVDDSPASEVESPPSEADSPPELDLPAASEADPPSSLDAPPTAEDPRELEAGGEVAPSDPIDEDVATGKAVEEKRRSWLARLFGS